MALEMSDLKSCVYEHFHTTEIGLNEQRSLMISLRNHE